MWILLDMQFMFEFPIGWLATTDFLNLFTSKYEIEKSSLNRSLGSHLNLNAWPHSIPKPNNSDGNAVRSRDTSWDKSILSNLCVQQLFSWIESVIYLDRGHPQSTYTQKGRGGVKPNAWIAYKGGGWNHWMGWIYRKYLCIKGAQANWVWLRTMGEGGGV